MFIGALGSLKFLERLLLVKTATFFFYLSLELSPESMSQADFVIIFDTLADNPKVGFGPSPVITKE